MSGDHLDIFRQLVQNGDGTQTSEYIIGSAVTVDPEEPNLLFVR